MAVFSSHMLALNFPCCFLVGESVAWNFHASALCQNSVICLACVPLLGSIHFATLDWGPSRGVTFSNAEVESHVRRVAAQLTSCLSSLSLPEMHSPVFLSLWSSDLWEGCIRSSFCILRVPVLVAKKKKMRRNHFVRCISHNVVTNWDFCSVP